MPEEKKLPVPDHLVELVEAAGQATQGPNKPSEQEDKEESQAEPTDFQKQMLTALETQAHQTELMETELRELREERASGKQYISSLEQRGATAPPAAGPQSVDFNSMSQDEIVQYMQQTQSTNLSNMASQFGELLELVAPDADIFKSRDAMYGLMTSGLSPKQAFKTLQARAADQKAPANAQGTTKDSEIEAEVKNRVEEALTQNRSSKAGISGKPARNDATAPALSARALFDACYDEWVVKGEEIPAKYTRGL